MSSLKFSQCGVTLMYNEEMTWQNSLIQFICSKLVNQRGKQFMPADLFSKNIVFFFKITLKC